MTEEKRVAEENQNVAADARSADSPRRGFVAGLIAMIVGSIAGMWSVVSGLVVFLDPYQRKQKVPKFYEKVGGASDSEFVRVASIDSVPDDGVPRRFAVIKDVVDAWTFSPNQPVGAVYVRRKKDAKDNEIQVFHATCPHAGCAVSFRSDQNVFLCPCHNSSFNSDGQKIDLPGKDNPSPRPMDTLEYVVDDQGNINVKFMDFYTGDHHKKPKI